MCFLAAALFSIGDPFNTTVGFCFFYHLLRVCRLYVPLHLTRLLLTSAPRSPHFLFEVSWNGWRTWLRASQVAGLGPSKAKEPICSYLHISQVDVTEGAIRVQLQLPCSFLLKNSITLPAGRRCLPQSSGTTTAALSDWGSLALIWTLVQDGAQQPTERRVCALSQSR